MSVTLLLLFMNLWSDSTGLDLSSQTGPSWSLLIMNPLLLKSVMEFHKVQGSVLFIVASITRQHLIKLLCYADDSHLYLSMEPDQTSQLWKLQAASETSRVQSSYS